jgi:hypothetical protein
VTIQPRRVGCPTTTVEAGAERLLSEFYPTAHALWKASE